MRLNESDIDLHGFLRAFYSCQSLGRSFVMDHQIQRPIPSYANFSYGKKDYASILKEVLNPLGLKLVQGKWIDAIVVLPPKEPVPPSAPPAPFMGASAEQRGGQNASLSPAIDSSPSDSSGASSPEAIIPEEIPPVPRISRRLRAEASGLLRSSARKMGVSYTELIATASPSGSFSYPHLFSPNSSMRTKFNENINTSHLWQMSAYASDSLGTNDFARIVVFDAFDTARVVFGGEIRRPESEINFDNGTAATKYSSIFDGLTLTVNGDSWSFSWRGEGSVLEVPGSLGSCATGSSKVKYSGRAGIPFLSSIPFLGYIFSYESKYDDELLITVCLEVVNVKST